MTTDAAESLARADALTSNARQSTRWYGRYLLAYAAGAFLLSLAFGLIPVKTAMIVVMPLWILFISAISVYAQRHKTALKGLGALQAWVIGSWAVLWGFTISFGVSYFQDWLPWWVLGGIVLALPGLIGALVVFRRSRA